MLRAAFRIALVLAALALLGSVLVNLKRLAPPNPVVIETGPVGGSYHQNATRYAQRLEAAGFKVSIRPNPNSLESIAHVNGEGPVADIGFTAQQVNPASYPNVASAGSIEVQPLLLFYQARLGELRSPVDLAGKRLVMPPQRSATAEAARSVLALYGVTEANTTFTYLPIAEAVAALKAGGQDAGLFMLGPSSPIVLDLGADDKLQLMSFAAAAGVAGKLDWLRSARLPLGAFDISRSHPAKDTDLVGATVNVVVRKDLHPSVLYALLTAMDDIHNPQTLVSPAGEFPNLMRTSVPVHPLAAQFAKTGTPWLYRNVPPFFARLVDQYLLLGLGLLLLVEGYRVFHYLREFNEFFAVYVALRILKRLDARSAAGKSIGPVGSSLLAFAEGVVMRHDEHKLAEQLLARVRRRVQGA